MTFRTIFALTAFVMVTPFPVSAHGPSKPANTQPEAPDQSTHKASSHAPIGVMRDHVHKRGEFMLSYRFMAMDMQGSRDGRDRLSPETIATTIPNRFVGQPGMPPTLRVVPLQMDMQMHMVGAMYGLTDRITLTAMGGYTTNDMDHVTFAGGMGTTELGKFTTKTDGFSDTRLGALLSLHDADVLKTHVGLAVSLPTGSTSQTDDILTPMNTRPSPRLPYPMQLGSGTFDLVPSATVTGRNDRLSWGGQLGATWRLERSNGYKLGDLYRATAWAAFDLDPSLSLSARIDGRTLGRIRGNDPLIRGPVQTADPDNYGGDTLTVLAGANYLFKDGPLRGNRFAAEFGVPVYRDLNGPQLETDWTMTLGWQRAFK